MDRLIDLLRDKYWDKKWFLFLQELVYRYEDDQVPEIGAQLTYYLILAIFPFIIFFLNLLKYTPLANKEVVSSLLSILPMESQKILTDLIREILANSNRALLSFGALASIWSASNGILAIIKAVNRAYDLEEDRPFWKIRGLSIIFTLGLFLILLLALSILVFGETIFNMIFQDYSLSLYILWKIIRVLLPFIVMVLVFSLLYKLAPSIKEDFSVSFKSTLAGSVFASIGIIIFSSIFSYYINNFGNYTNTYGSIGGIIILLIWMYISSIVIVLGAEVNATILSMKEYKKEPA